MKKNELTLLGKWAHYNAKNCPLPSDGFVYQLSISKTGELWADVFINWSDEMGGGLSRTSGFLNFKQNQWKFFSTDDIGFPEMNVTQLGSDEKGNLWLEYWPSSLPLKRATMARFDGKSLNVFLPGTRGLPSEIMVTSFAGDSQGKAWAAMSMLGAYFYDGTVWHQFRDPCLLAQDWLTCVAVDQENRTWLAAQQEKRTRFVYYDGRKCVPYAKVERGTQDAYVRAMLVDNAGNLWVGWNSRLGVWFFHGQSGQWQQFTRRNSALPDTEIFSMTIDSQGRVWVGTEDGATIFTGAESVSYGAVIPGKFSPPVRIWDIDDPMTGEDQSKHVTISKFLGADSQGHVWSSSSFGLSVYTE
jgi:ligand-binding sensor domain-containing protein